MYAERFIERWLPLREAADEGVAGGDVPVDTGDAGGAAEAPPPSGPGSGRSDLRQQLEKNFDTDRKNAAKRDATARRVRRVAGGAEITDTAAPEADAGAVEGAVEGEAPVEAPKPAVAAPEGFPNEAKGEAWAKTPPTVQAAIAKRIDDMTKGVAELKGRYSQIDQALAPHLDAIRAVNQSPPQAISQLFGWFQALSSQPRVAFPALLQSFNLKMEDVFGAQQPQPGQPQAADQPAEAISPALQQFIDSQTAKINNLEQAFAQKIGGLETTFAQQSQAKTDEILANWSQGKPHFEDVRQLMATFIGSGAVPLKDGKVDLDKAYEMAIYADPAVRSQVLTAQQEELKKQAVAKATAEKKAQQEAADKARRAAVSVSGAAPGVPGAPVKATGKRKSVRESINDAMSQLAD